MITAEQAKAITNTLDEQVISRFDQEIREAAEQGLRRVHILYFSEDASVAATFLRTQGFTATYNRLTWTLEVGWDD